MSSPVHQSRLATFTISDVEIPVGSDDNFTVERRPEVRFGAAVGNQPRSIEWVGDPSVTIAAEPGSQTVANRVLAVLAATCYAAGSQALAADAVLKDIEVTTTDGFRFTGKGYVMMPTSFANGNATPTRAYKIMIPNAEPDASGVSAALAAAGVIG